MKTFLKYLAASIFMFLVGFFLNKYDIYSYILPQSKLSIVGDKLYDFGEIKQGSDGSCFFKYMNSGNSPLIIEDIESNCGCTVPAWNKKPLKPKQVDSFLVKYDTHIMGPFTKNITIYTNNPKENKKVFIRGYVIK